MTNLFKKTKRRKEAMNMNNKTGRNLWNKAKKIIPGGSQLLSKRSEQFLPDQWPAYYKEATGVEILDLDGNRLTDMCLMGVGACILGYADPDVNREVKKAIDMGSMSTLNCPEEVELAEVLLKIHPWAGMVRYSRCGGEAMAVAVRIARAYSGKEKVAFCGYHGWHDWYLAANLADDKNLDGHLLSGLEPAGVPRGLKGTSIPFNYNKIEDLERITEKNELGAIVMEPMRHHAPEKGFLERVRKIAEDTGAVLVFDEITSGWRMNASGVHELYGVQPDIVVYGKAMSNGYPMSAIIGKSQVMDAAQKSFISSTYWTERIGPTAALATIEKIRSLNVPKHLCSIGRDICDGWDELSKKHVLDIEILDAFTPLPVYSIKHPEAQAMRTLITQEMLKRGFLAGNSVYVSYAHKKEHVEKYLENLDEVFALVTQAVEKNDVRSRLNGPLAQQGFKRLN